MKNFLEKIRLALTKFMYGRYGNDYLNRDMSTLALVVIIINLFVKVQILNIVVLLLIAACYFRMLSKNRTKRYKENAWYMTHVRNHFKGIKSAPKRDKNYKYFKCPGCGQSLRAPKGKGKIRVTCSKCGTVFEKNV